MMQRRSQLVEFAANWGTARIERNFHVTMAVKWHMQSGNAGGGHDSCITIALPRLRCVVLTGFHAAVAKCFHGDASREAEAIGYHF